MPTCSGPAAGASGEPASTCSPPVCVPQACKIVAWTRNGPRLRRRARASNVRNRHSCGGFGRWGRLDLNERPFGPQLNNGSVWTRSNPPDGRGFLELVSGIVGGRSAAQSASKRGGVAASMTTGSPAHNTEVLADDFAGRQSGGAHCGASALLKSVRHCAFGRVSPACGYGGGHKAQVACATIPPIEGDSGAVSCTVTFLWSVSGSMRVSQEGPPSVSPPPPPGPWSW
jgi:hypothetical protein